MLFGTKIDINTLAAMPQYANPTSKDCAAQALTEMGSNQKDADNNVNSMKEKYGNGVSTQVMIYNASGADLTFSNLSDSSGHMGDWPVDPVVGNGQWSVFLHVHTSGAATGSIASATYTTDKPNSAVSLSWETPYTGTNTASGAAVIVQLTPSLHVGPDPDLVVQATAGQGSTAKDVFLIKWRH